MRPEGLSAFVDQRRGAFHAWGMVGDDGVSRNSAYVMPAPHDHPGWHEMKAAADAQHAASVGWLAGQLQSSVETLQVGSASVHVATPETSSKTGRAYIDLHGGALMFGFDEGCRAGALMQADQHGVPCCGVDYRPPPEHPYLAALDDCLAVYRHVLERNWSGMLR